MEDFMQFNTFLTTEQESLRLSTAFQEYFHTEDLPLSQYTAYESYLRLRKRPVLLRIMKDSDSRALKHFLENGWMDERLLAESFSLAAECQNTEILALLFHYQHKSGLSCKMGDIYEDFD